MMLTFAALALSLGAVGWAGYALLSMARSKTGETDVLPTVLAGLSIAATLLTIYGLRRAARREADHPRSLPETTDTLALAVLAGVETYLQRSHRS